MNRKSSCVCVNMLRFEGRNTSGAGACTETGTCASNRPSTASCPSSPTRRRASSCPWRSNATEPKWPGQTHRRFTWAPHWPCHRVSIGFKGDDSVNSWELDSCFRLWWWCHFFFQECRSRTGQHYVTLKLIISSSWRCYSFGTGIHSEIDLIEDFCFCWPFL